MSIKGLGVGDSRMVLTGLHSGQGVVGHKWGALGTASAVLSHREGSMVSRVAVQSRGLGSTPREVAYLQLGSPAICVWLCTNATGRVLAYADKRLTALNNNHI